MKRVLLIENRPDYGMGGVENYNRKLFNILERNFKNIQIDRAAFLPCENVSNPRLFNNYYHIFDENNNYRTKNGELNFIKISFLFLKFRCLVYKLYNKNHYDLIIDSTIASFKKFRNQNFYFWVQHNTPSFYSLQYIRNKSKRLIFHLAERFFGIFNNLIYATNLILYDQYNYDEVKENRTLPFNGYIIHLSNFVPLNFENTLASCIAKKERIIYFGRIDNSQKNINLILQINNKIHLIDFYGKGDPILIKKLGDSYKGFLDNNADLQQLLTKYKFMILMSNYEGFSFSIVQALCYGLPVIIEDTFASAKFLTNNNENGFLLNNNLSADEYAKQILDIYHISNEEYLKLSLNAYHFAKANLSDEQFEQRWLKIFHQHLDK